MNILDIDTVPREKFACLPTPVIELKKLSELLKGPRIFMKRDDLTGVGLGGNKTRKLEFLMSDALAQGCDSVITGGAMQSNHCRQTAAAAAVTGFECHLALGGEAPLHPEGNLLLDHLLGATIHWCGANRKGESIPDIAGELRREGRKPYIIPYGGSNATGALGYVLAIAEVKEQLSALGVTIDYMIFPSSSGGTHAGMVVGADLYKMPVKMIGIGIDKREPGEGVYEEELAALSNALAGKLGLPASYNPDTFCVKHGYTGDGYGIVGDLEREAIRRVASSEGILLDPVYTGRAMGGMIDMIRKKEITRRDTVLFWHTGGIPALFSYAKDLDVFREKP